VMLYDTLTSVSVHDFISLFKLYYHYINILVFCFSEQNNSVLDSPRSENRSERGSHFGDSKSSPPGQLLYHRGSQY